MLNATQGFTFNKFEKPNDWPQLDKTFDYKIENGKLLSGNEHIYLSGPVTYTVVGSPTIKDNIASGFSTSNRLSIGALPIDQLGTVEWCVKFKTGSAVKGQGISGTMSNWGCWGFRTSQSNKIVSTLGYSPQVELTGPELSANTNYIAKSTYNNTTKYFTLSLSIDNGQTWETTSTTVTQEFTLRNQTIVLGATQQGTFTGSIDLTGTYIKVNDRLWFYGKNYTDTNIVVVPDGLEYNNTTTPSIGWVNTNTDRVKGQRDYVLVGSPTIVNGIVSGFTTSDFIRFRPMDIPYAGLKIRMYFTVNTALSETQVLFRTQKSGGARSCTCNILPSDSGDFRIRLAFTPNSQLWNSDLHLSAGTEYYAEAETSATDIKFTVGTDEGGVLYSGTAENTSFASEICYTCDIGCYSNATPFSNGSVNMNKSFAILNKFVWAGFVPSEFQQFTAAPQGTMIGKDETEMLQVETYQDKGTVDYTIVGNPTITNGVVSGFSNNNYLQTTANFPISGFNNTEIQIKYNTSSNSDRLFRPGISTSNALFLGGNIDGYFVYYGLTKRFFTNKKPSNYKYVNLKIDNGGDNLVYLKVSNDGVSWEDATLTQETIDNRTLLDSFISFGYNSSSLSIDLNETYIKVNGQMWFHPYPNSYPKLVGPVTYTTAGSPTIINGIASGFSGSDYLQLNNKLPFSSINSFELQMKYNTSDLQNVAFFRNGTNASNAYNLRSLSGGDFAWYSTTKIYTTDKRAADYKYVKLFVNDWNGEHNVTIEVSNDKILWESATVTESNVSRNLPNASPLIGYSIPNASIDLNETYIKVNGKLWFGKEDWKPSTYTDNAIYLLGSHKADYLNYNQLSLTPSIETESDEVGSYNVWIDNQKVIENKTGNTLLEWDKLALTTGYSVTTPSALKAHPIKIEPTNTTDSIIAFNTETIEESDESI